MMVGGFLFLFSLRVTGGFKLFLQVTLGSWTRYWEIWAHPPALTGSFRGFGGTMARFGCGCQNQWDPILG